MPDSVAIDSDSQEIRYGDFDDPTDFPELIPENPELVQLRSELSALKARIAYIACKHAADYPGIESAEPLEQLYAVSSSLEGTDLAIGDWEKFVDHLGKKLFGDAWCPAVLIEEWRKVVKI